MNYEDSPKPCQPERDSHIRRAFNSQEKAIHEQTHLVGELVKKLQPITLPASESLPHDVTKEPCDTAVPLAVRIHEGRRSIEANSRTLISLIKSIEL